MATIDQLKVQIDLEDLAQKLGLRRGTKTKKGAMYHSPHHEDKDPSLSIFTKDGRQGWKDWSQQGAGGTCIDLVMYVEGIDDVAEASRRLHELYGIPLDHPEKNTRAKSLPEHIAEESQKDPSPVIEYLKGRGIPEATIQAAINAKALGWNTYTNPKHSPGEKFHGGPAAAFIVRERQTHRVVAVDLRFQDPELNGGLKTQCQGDKDGQIWTMDWRRLERAREVYAFESSINALSMEACEIPGTAAIAVLGVGNIENIDFSFLRGKMVRICMDNDEPNEKGVSPGREAAWALYERLVAYGVAATLIDQRDWEHNDANDIIQALGVDELKYAMRRFEQWVIPGLPADAGDRPMGRHRVFLPAHDFEQYWRFRAKDDFTTYIAKRETTDEGQKDSFKDLCGFRIAALTRVTISGTTATTTGEKDNQPRVLFVAFIQTPRNGPTLIRRVFDDETIHNIDHWRKLGPIFAPAQFSRLLTILERTAHMGAMTAVNFVGLAWKDGAPVVQQGADCFFEDPKQQCPYAELSFPSGRLYMARHVIEAYQATFRDNAATLLLVWALGAHMKAFLGFGPTHNCRRRKGRGKRH